MGSGKNPPGSPLSSLLRPPAFPPAFPPRSTGWLTHWGEGMANTSTSVLLHATQALLEYANSTASLSFYMLHG